MNEEQTSSREEVLRSIFAGMALTAIVGFVLAAVLYVNRIEEHPSLWWLAIVGIVLCTLVWFLQTTTVERDWQLSRLGSRVGTRGHDFWLTVSTVVATVVCAVFVREWLVVPTLSVVAFVALSLLRERVHVERTVPDLYRPPVPPEDLEYPKPRGPEEGREAEEAATALRTFTWDVRFTSDEIATLTIRIKILLQRLEAFRQKNPYRETGLPRECDYVEFVNRGITAEVLEAAVQIRKYTDDNKWAAFHEVCAVLAFVQSIPYSLDKDSVGHEEYWRYPIETLHDQTGDCEDTSILAASILRALGHEVVMLDMPGHVAIGVGVGDGFPGGGDRLVRQRYLYCETTQEGWRVGQVPEGIDPSSIQVVVLP